MNTYNIDVEYTPIQDTKKKSIIKFGKCKINNIDIRVVCNVGNKELMMGLTL